MHERNSSGTNSSNASRRYNVPCTTGHFPRTEQFPEDRAEHFPHDDTPGAWGDQHTHGEANLGTSLRTAQPSPHPAQGSRAFYVTCSLDVECSLKQNKITWVIFAGKSQEQHTEPWAKDTLVCPPSELVWNKHGRARRARGHKTEGLMWGLNNAQECASCKTESTAALWPLLLICCRHTSHQQFAECLQFWMLREV